MCFYKKWTSKVFWILFCLEVRQSQIVPLVSVFGLTLAITRRHWLQHHGLSDSYRHLLPKWHRLIMHVCGFMSLASLSLSQNVVALILVLRCYFVLVLYLDQHTNAASAEPNICCEGVAAMPNLFYLLIANKGLSVHSSDGSKKKKNLLGACHVLRLGACWPTWIPLNSVHLQADNWSRMYFNNDPVVDNEGPVYSRL